MLAALALPACSVGDQESEGGDFVGDNPGGSPNGRGDEDAAGESGGDGEAAPDDGEDGERDITEADIVQIEGNRLYALSRYGGLTVIDISRPDVFPVLGRHRVNAQPFEMYVDEAQVFVMYSDFGSYDYDEATGGFTWKSSSRLLALDTTRASDIEVRGEFELPGSIQDSRRVGDVLYLVTFEDGYCWLCADTPSTVVTSLDVSDEANVTLVDQLRFENDSDIANEWGWSGPRSVSATDERMYVAGLEYSDAQTEHSVIDVIDISDPGGALVLGARVEVAGQISNRWQMDEYEGVLRVVSQPGFWNSSSPPRIETFAVTSAAEIAPLGGVDMVLPRPESLQSVRFDGPRGYAITFEQTDPLFTLDLSDPSVPRQVGELEIPGFVYHMEPRGDRLIGIGFDTTNENGAINVSVFDVSDFANPTMLSRVNFGGDWASFSEDQNRIHKSFQILDELGLMLVPYQGWDWAEASCESAYQSGIQLVDWQDDNLTLRGVAPSHGQARRGLIHEQRLLGISDMAVESFDISDRDTPVKTSELTLAANVSSMAFGDGVIVRLSNDWWTNEALLEVANAADPENPDALGRLRLDSFLASDVDTSEGCYWGGFYDTDMFVHEGFVYLVREVWSGNDESTVLDVVDIRDPSAPAYVEQIELPFTRGWSYGPYLGNDEQRAAIVGDTLVMFAGETEWHESTQQPSSTASFELVDLRDPAHPTHARSIARPSALAHGGLQVFDGVIVSWHMGSANADASKVRFYLDRLDLPTTDTAAAAEPVNVPGTVVAWDETTKRAVTVDFQLETTTTDSRACWSHPRSWNFDERTGECQLYRRDLQLVEVAGERAVLLDTAALEGENGAVRSVAASESRLFVELQRGAWRWEDEGSAGYTEVPTTELAVFSSWTGDELTLGNAMKIGGAYGWVSGLQALDTRAVFVTENGLGEVDATDPTSPSVDVHDLFGYYCSDLEAEGSQVYCAMGEFGLQMVSLDQVAGR